MPNLPEVALDLIDLDDIDTFFESKAKTRRASPVNCDRRDSAAPEDTLPPPEHSHSSTTEASA